MIISSKIPNFIEIRSIFVRKNATLPRVIGTTGHNVKKLSCRRETALRFVSLNISLSHSRSLKVTLLKMLPFESLGTVSCSHSISNYGRIFSRFNTIHERDGHVGQTPHDSIGRAYAWMAWQKYNSLCRAELAEAQKFKHFSPHPTLVTFLGVPTGV